MRISQSSSTQRTRHVPRIHGRRGTALVAVLLFHAGVHNPALSAERRLAISFIVRYGSDGVVVAAGCIPLLRKALSAKVLVAAGAASYGIYLVHEPIVALIERSTAQSAGAVGTYALAVAGAFAAGTVFSLLAEQPFVNSGLRRKLLAFLEPVMRSLCQRLGLHADVELGRSRSTETMAA